MAGFAQLQSNDSLPAAVHAETAILGAMLLNEPMAFTDATAKLVAEDFSLDSHKRIFRAVVAAKEAYQSKYDYIVVREILDQRKELDSIGGPAYLMFLTEGIPRHLNIESYVRIVKDKARLREMVYVGHDLYNEASDRSADPQELLERMIDRLRAAALDGDAAELQSIGDFFQSQGAPEEMFNAMATVDGVNLGFAQLHELTGGPQKGELWVVAARPNMGKTAWACNTSRHVAVQEERVAAFFTLEQRRQAIIRRMLSSSARIDNKNIRENTLRSEDRRVLLEHRGMLMKAPLYLDDQPGLTVSRIKSRCYRLKHRVGLEIVFIDQLSKVSNKDVYQRGMPKHEWVGAQTNALKLMAQELEVPVVLFNQLKRPDGKGGAVPTLSDLKESGSIEEDADVVVLLHRPEYYDKSDKSLEGVGQMIVAKNREGATKSLDCLYQGRILRWEDDYVVPAQQESFYGDYKQGW